MLVGLAGGIAANSGRKKGPLSRLTGSGSKSRFKTPSVKAPKLPKVDLGDALKDVKPGEALKAIGKAAGEVAQRSQRVGEVAAEVQKASDAIGNGTKR